MTLFGWLFLGGLAILLVGAVYLTTRNNNQNPEG